MASPSPVKSTGGVLDGSVLSTPLTSSKSLRGLNKPKCIKCGNVARSRCPYQSCKSCCVKAENPCHIHVLKGSSSLPDKAPYSSSPLSDQQQSDASHLGNAHRLRHLSTNFAQFNNLQSSVRPRKPLTKKDAQVINEWRFTKLKEFKDGKALAEGEAFDRYMQNVSLLEEIFSVHSEPDDQLRAYPSSGLDSSNHDENTENLVNSLRLKLCSDQTRSESFRKRIKDILDQGLKNLITDEGDAPDDVNGTKKMKYSQSERETALSDLLDKLQKARNDEDFKECKEIASQVFKSKSESNQTGTSVFEKECRPLDEEYLFPKWVRMVSVDQDSICKMDAKFSSLDEIEDL